MKRKTFVKVGKKSRKWQVSPLSESSKTIRTMASLKILLCQLWRYIKLHSSSNFMVSFSILVRRQLHEKPHFWKVNQWRDWLLYSTSLTLRKENKRPPLTVFSNWSNIGDTISMCFPQRYKWPRQKCELETLCSAGVERFPEVGGLPRENKIIVF